MKHWIVVTATLLVGVWGFAQSTDSTSSLTDTIKAGNFIIIKKNKSGNNEYKNSNEKNGRIININIDSHHNYKKQPGNISTNWGIFDLGFTNFNDNTNYTAAQSGGYLKVLRPSDGPVTQNNMLLKTAKSTNVNIWFFMQKLNVTKHIVNLKYGLGLEMYNFRFDKSISYRKDPAAFVFNDSISFSKNKLYVGYLTVPFMVNFNITPSRNNGFSFSAGVSAGYLLGSHNKQVSGQRGKQKIKGDFDLQPWRLAAIGELGLGPIRLYGTYSLNKLHKESTGLDQIPYAVGIRFSNW